MSSLVWKSQIQYLATTSTFHGANLRDLARIPGCKPGSPDRLLLGNHRSTSTLNLIILRLSTMPTFTGAEMCKDEFLWGTLAELG
ncbi:hypothetical protein LTR36_009763 [Oleoguttula mirabilis]|uniref:Uncharacterized protein n=1 Tax=Oleoguttula mirabilis TaxID=1507867 RepID=A0AAV9J5X5_9PEZI|nr:hypothetical protein LTR36_009763 [Oleoguttula mirabilis]